MRTIQPFGWLMLVLLVAGTFNVPGQAQAAGSGCLLGVLKQRLGQIRQKFGPVSIVSTHRRGARIAGSGRRSYHASCRAVDFLAPRGKYAAVIAWLKSNHRGGVGTYSCGMHHIHIDNGPRVRYHHCVSASGRPQRRYASKRRRTRVARASVRRPGYGRTAQRSTSRSRSSTRRVVVARPARPGFSSLGYFRRRDANGA